MAEQAPRVDEVDPNQLAKIALAEVLASVRSDWNSTGIRIALQNKIKELDERPDDSVL